MQHQLFATPASLSAVAAEPPRRLFAGHEGMAKKRSSNDNCSGGLWTRHWRTPAENPELARSRYHRWQPPASQRPATKATIGPTTIATTGLTEAG